MSYETRRLSNRQTHFNTRSECLNSVKYCNTNPRFENFNQVLFHAGDREDLERYAFLQARQLQTLAGDGGLAFTDLEETVMHMFDLFKKGVIVVFRGGKLVSFVPFSNANYGIGDVVKYLYVDEKDKKMLEKYTQTKSEKLYAYLMRRFEKYAKQRGWRVNPDRRKWVLNNCIFRSMPKPFEGDQNIALLEYWMQRLANEREIPDCVLLINVRDFPLMPLDGSHPYKDIVPQGEQCYGIPTYPVCSFSGKEGFADVPVPNPSDMTNATEKALYFPDGCQRDDTEPFTDWSAKEPKAVFRGTNTGCGVDSSLNMRIRLVKEIAKARPDLLDATFTSINMRIRKPSINRPIDAPHKKRLSPTGNFLDFNSMTRFRYIVNVDGYVRAYRLGNELRSMSVILLQASPYRLWFEHLLKPYVHYVPIAADLGDLIEKIEWCKRHDEECKKIVENALALHGRIMGGDGILDAWAGVAKKIASRYADTARFYQRPVNHDKIRRVIVTANPSRVFLDNLRGFLPDTDIMVMLSGGTNQNKAMEKGLEIAKAKGEYDVYLKHDPDILPGEDLLHHYLDVPAPGEMIELVKPGRVFSTRGGTATRVTIIDAEIIELKLEENEPATPTKTQPHLFFYKIS